MVETARPLRAYWNAPVQGHRSGVSHAKDEPMKTNATLIKDADGRTVKRAQYEAFEFGIDAPGLVRVTNGSYGDDAENHSYLVDVEEVQQSIS